MTITNAEKKCDELQEQIKDIKEKYQFSEGYAKYEGEKKIKPLYNEWNKLITLIDKAKNETNIRYEKENHKGSS